MPEVRPPLDPEEGIRALIALKTDIPIARIGTWPKAEVPVATDGDLYVSVEAFEGLATELLDEPVMEINVWGRTTKSVKDAHAAILDAILRYPRSVMVGNRRFVVDNPRCNSRATREEWPDEKVRRMSAMFQFSVRR